MPLSTLGQSAFAPAIQQAAVPLKDLGGKSRRAPVDPNFARNSAYAVPQASYQTTLDPPAWNDKDQLVLPNGQVVFDERAK